jgi:hypothetical protein
MDALKISKRYSKEVALSDISIYTPIGNYVRQMYNALYPENTLSATATLEAVKNTFSDRMTVAELEKEMAGAATTEKQQDKLREVAMAYREKYIPDLESDLGVMKAAVLLEENHQKEDAEALKHTVGEYQELKELISTLTDKIDTLEAQLYGIDDNKLGNRLKRGITETVDKLKDLKKGLVNGLHAVGHGIVNGTHRIVNSVGLMKQKAMHKVSDIINLTGRLNSLRDKVQNGIYETARGVIRCDKVADQYKEAQASLNLAGDIRAEGGSLRAAKGLRQVERGIESTEQTKKLYEMLGTLLQKLDNKLEQVITDREQKKERDTDRTFDTAPSREDAMRQEPENETELELV